MRRWKAETGKSSKAAGPDGLRIKQEKTKRGKDAVTPIVESKEGLGI